MMDHGEGIFTMDKITLVTRCKTIGEAKGIALQTILDSKATEKNKIKAERMCHAARSTAELAIAMSNFSLSHQGLKTIR